jgi:glycosyltransferase involved in cell wall biosynthesis
MTGKPLITVVTVVLNRKDDLETTIKSVLDQTYDNIEYVVIDGGSSDGTLEVIRKYSRDIDHWQSEPDEGIYDAMNKSIRLATGEWINFMNAGDHYYDSDTVSKVVRDMPPDTDIVYGHHEIRYGAKDSKLFHAGTIDNLWKRMDFSHQSTFIRTALFKQHPFDTQLRIVADFALFYALHREGRKFSRIAIPVASIAFGGISHRRNIRAAFEQWAVVRRHSPTYLVDGYYATVIAIKSVKSLIKMVLPEQLITRIRLRI